MSRLPESRTEVVSIAHSKFALRFGDGSLVIWKQPNHLTFEIEGRGGKVKGQVALTFATAREMAQEILDATSAGRNPTASTMSHLTTPSGSSVPGANGAG